MAKLRRKIQKFFFREQWSLLVCDISGKILKHIAPAKGISWADPFPIESNGHYYIFIEQQIGYNNGTLGYIELFSDLSHSPFVTILEKNYHLSYPNVFSLNVEGQNKWYMIPESNENNTIDLYAAVDFPGKWEYERTLLSGIKAVDTSIINQEGYWYLFTSCETDTTGLNDSLFIFSSESFPSSEWKAHPANPARHNLSGSRMAGRIFLDNNGRMIRPAQSCVREYGESLILNLIGTLDQKHFSETKCHSYKPEGKYFAVCTHTWNQSGEYLLRDIKTRIARIRR